MKKNKEQHHATGLRMLEAIEEHDKTAAAPLMGLVGATGSGYATYKMSKDDENRKYKTMAGAVMGYGAGNVAGKALQKRMFDKTLAKLDKNIASNNAKELARSKAVKEFQDGVAKLKTDPKWKANKLKEMKKVLKNQQEFAEGLKGTQRYEGAVRQAKEYAKKVQDFQKTARRLSRYTPQPSKRIRSAVERVTD